MKGSSSQTSEGICYLYEIFMYSVGEFSHSLHRIELPDLNLSSETHRHEAKDVKDLPEPLLKLPYEKFPGFMGFLSSGSKIYMFGGEKYYPGKKRKQLALYNDCYVFDTCNNPKNEIKPIDPMEKAKFMPIVLGPLPLNGKFYVLSSSLASGDLEEFNPTNESWKHIGGPNLKGNKYGRHDHQVLSHAIFENLLLFSTPKGIFTFDVGKGEWNIPTSSLGGGDKMFPFIYEAKFFSNFWYAFSSPIRAELQAYDYVEGKGFQGNYRVHGLGGPSELVEHETVNIMVPLVDRKFCIVRSGIPEYGTEFYVTIDVCELTVKSNEQPECPEVSKHHPITYVQKGYEWTPLTTTCLFVPSN